MQRRLVIAFATIALLAVVLVGVGILVLANIGARAEARDRVVDQVEALADGLGVSGDRAVLLGRLERQRVAFDLQNLEIVTVIDDGTLRTAPTRRGQGATPGFETVLDDAELAAFASGEATSFDRGADVFALQRLEPGDAIRVPADTELGLLLGERVRPLPQRARQWFAISAGLVVLAAVGAAVLLARRLAAPVRAIEQATSRIAEGDLTARVEVRGDDEVADLGRSVNAMAADLERSRQLEQQFLLSVSHDLRTPLTAIRAYGEALTDGAVDDTRRAGAVVTSNADRLARLVADLLQLARLDARQFDFDAVDVSLAALARRHVDGIQPIAAEHDLSITAAGSSPAVVRADPDRLGQILGNLVENAIKYAASSIVVEASEDPTTSEGVITVTDDGAGIPAADLPHVFERLYVTQARPVRAEQSSGLGLAIVAQLTTAMGGRVEVAAPVADGRGTRFEIRLPLRDTAPPTP